MRSVLNPRDCAQLSQRVASVAESSTPRWGKMTALAMLSHLCRASLMALGELPVQPHGKRVFQVFPMKHLMLYALPFPKGVPTAPELLEDEQRSFAAAQALLQSLLQRIGAAPTTGMGPTHPLFGRLSWQEWGALMHKHADHHLRQFGA